MKLYRVTFDHASPPYQEMIAAKDAVTAERKARRRIRELRAGGRGAALVDMCFVRLLRGYESASGGASAR